MATDAKPQQRPQPRGVLDPEEGPPVEQDVAQRAAAERGESGDHADPDRIEALARSFDEARQCEGNGSQRFDGHLHV